MVEDERPIGRPDVGLECDRCGCRHFWVRGTRVRIPGVIVRQRECRHCGRVIVTHERQREPRPPTA